MTDTKWGEPIAVNGVRPDWLRDGQIIQYRMGDDHWYGGGKHDTAISYDDGSYASIDTIRLPSDHPYYLATSRGFTYWPGGDEAPADWDGGEVLAQDGDLMIASQRSRWHRAGYGGDIIGYRRRAEPAAPAETVTIKRMTEEDIRAMHVKIQGGNAVFSNIIADGIVAYLKHFGAVITPAERIAAQTGVALADVQKVLSAQ